MATTPIYEGPSLAKRRKHALRWIDLENSKGIEIGALDRPLVTTSMSDVQYVDHATTNDLVAKYAAQPNVHPDRLVAVSSVWGQKSLREVVGEQELFGYVVASHVIEHVPDFIGWLEEVRSVLNDGGILSLVVPDRRFTFDYTRTPTATSAIIDAHVAGLRRPSPGQVYDHFSQVVHLDADVAWTGEFALEGLRRKFSDRVAIEKSRHALETDDYVDVHCWVFTPQSFFEVFADLARMGLIDFTVAGFIPTERGRNEFYVALEALSVGDDPQHVLASQLSSIPSTSDLVLGQENSLMALKQPLSELVKREGDVEANVAGILRQLSQEVALIREGIALSDGYARRIAELQQQVEERDRRIAELLASTSWKVTAPFRWLTTRLRMLR